MIDPQWLQMFSEPELQVRVVCSYSRPAVLGLKKKELQLQEAKIFKYKIETVETVGGGEREGIKKAHAKRRWDHPRNCCPPECVIFTPSR